MHSKILYLLSIQAFKNDFENQSNSHLIRFIFAGSCSAHSCRVQGTWWGKLGKWELSLSKKTLVLFLVASLLAFSPVSYHCRTDSGINVDKDFLLMF